MNFIPGLATVLSRAFIVVFNAFVFFVIGLCILGLIGKLTGLDTLSVMVLLILVTAFGGFLGWRIDRRDFVEMNGWAAKACLKWSVAIFKFYGAVFLGFIVGFQLLKFVVNHNPDFGIMPGLAILLGSPIALVWIVFVRGHILKPRGTSKILRRVFDARSCGLAVGRPMEKGQTDQQATAESRQK